MFYSYSTPSEFRTSGVCTGLKNIWWLCFDGCDWLPQLLGSAAQMNRPVGMPLVRHIALICQHKDQFALLWALRVITVARAVAFAFHLQTDHVNRRRIKGRLKLLVAYTLQLGSRLSYAESNHVRPPRPRSWTPMSCHRT